MTSVLASEHHARDACSLERGIEVAQIGLATGLMANRSEKFPETIYVYESMQIFKNSRCIVLYNISNMPFYNTPSIIQTPRIDAIEVCHENAI